MQAHTDAWDQDALLKSYLAKEREPHPSYVDPNITAARLALTKVHLNDLKDTTAKVFPRQSEVLAFEAAGASFRFKVLSWKAFEINQLPVEILQYIFRLIVCPRVHHKNIDTYRLHLTWVCRHWRYATFADPLLWNILYFRGISSRLSNWRRTSEFMLRAGAALLEIHVEDICQMDSFGRDVASKISPPQMYMLLRILSVKWSQVRIATFRLHTFPTFMQVLRDFSQDSGFHNPYNLELLHLRIDASPGHFHHPQALFGGLAPKLNHFSATGVPIDLNCLPLGENLTKLALCYIPQHLFPTSRRFLEILASAPNLFSLSLDRVCPKMELSQRRPIGRPAQLSKLNTLAIGNLAASEIQFVLSHFAAPNIKTLSFCSLGEVNDGSLAQFLTGRYPAVTNLLLDDILFEPNLNAEEAVVMWLDSMPEITYLKLVDLSEDNLFFFSSSSAYFSRRDTPVEEQTPFGMDFSRWLPMYGEDMDEFLKRQEERKKEEELTGYLEKPKPPRPKKPILVLPKLISLCVDYMYDLDIVELVNSRRKGDAPILNLILASPDLLPLRLAEEIAASGTNVRTVLQEDLDILMLDY